ncbi:rho-type GTPase-activating protein-like protein 2 [Clohesyomyces aquaticus]|uniref:Rho-type GTPase-activating protein-like protein 2 n=1 Tax=Clohesyomyces aquaticus TaxID=1231657 RepID=A0A1Y1ZAW0_9PLEO|nr:rho-type GTPase-activating protein-like protein 2 [Clohesyomyces aquaticus]
MESPGGYPESPTDQDDVVYPCKGCGEILEEGKAFELAGNRWHIDCFRCNTCGTLLDSDANLLLLGDGSLICNNCTYSCNHCGNKIEDLAILTGDQAFCANCFRCRNCKRKIENLRYARTSQGIFCMSCHESLMARRRKKSKKPPSSAGANPKIDKSLPALPPTEAPAFTPDLDTPSEIFSQPPTADVSPRPQHPRRQDSSPANHFRRDASPASMEDHRKGLSPAESTTNSSNAWLLDNATLPASTYKEPTHSETSDAGDDSIMLPFALDPNPAPGPSPLGKSRKLNEGPNDIPQNRGADGKLGRDYFNRPSATHRDMLKENRSRSTSTERQPKATPSSPHIAFQEKGRQPSESIADTMRKRKESAQDSPSAVHDRSRSGHTSSSSASQSTDAFKLQDVPKSKKAEARRGSKSDTRSPSHGASPIDSAGRMLSPAMETTLTASPTPLDTYSPADHHGQEDSPATSGSSYSSTQKFERPARGDSLAASTHKTTPVPRKEMASGSPTNPTLAQPERKPSGSSSRSQVNGNYSISSPVESQPVRSMLDPPAPPQRSAGRPAPQPLANVSENFTSPRAPPPPPPLPQHQQSHKPTESMSTVQSENSQGPLSPVGLPRYSAQGDFSMDEDFARLLSNQEHQESQGSVLRRVSNAMSKHGRSFSDRGSANGRGHKKWPANGSIDISSPTVASPDSKEESVNLRNELRRAQQRIAELEAEKNGLQETVNSAADIKQANTMLREKRNTMAVLDTQREMVIRELEIMTEHLKRAKEDSRALDINQLKSDVLIDFANSLQKLKDQLGGQIEDLIARRTELTDEISNLIQMKDKGFQEYESLSAQNIKLGKMNRDLIESIQTTLRDNKQHNGNHSIDAGRANGLGIYNPVHKGKSDISVDVQGMQHEPSYSNLHETESEATLQQPQVVNIRKTGKATTKFNWKKNGQNTIKGVTKGFKSAFASEPRQQEEYNIKVIGTPYGSVHTQPDIAAMSTASMSMKSKDEPPPRAGWFGGKSSNANRPQQDRKGIPNNNSRSDLNNENSSVLFGSDLTARCDFEKRVIPAIVTRCIEEVEIRGMDVEGIYRKSGANSQVNQVRNLFEANDQADISDPDLDIHAVTSTLKGYLRRLPVPLITYDVYDQFLEAGQIEGDYQKAQALLAAVNELPKAHRDCLQFLVFHLSRVIEKSEQNLMVPANLAVVFAPTIMRPMEIQRELSDSTMQRTAVQALFEHQKQIFGDNA